MVAGIILSILIVGASIAPKIVDGTPQPLAGKIWEDVSGEKAFEHVRKLVDFGPRPSGSEALEKSRAYITEQLVTAGWRVRRQAFTQNTPAGPIEFANLIADFSGPENRGSWKMFLLGSHFDTKRFDGISFVGANDAGSSTGLLLEIARVLAKEPRLAARIQLVFFDGEEALEQFTETDGLYGSRYFVKQLLDAKLTKQYRGGIVFDMVGDKSLTITFPPDSPVELARGLFASAEALNLRKYFTYFDRDVIDDHTPLNAAGIPTIDVIDFEFPQWHTADDNIDSISPESLRIVGAVALHYLAQAAFK